MEENILQTAFADLDAAWDYDARKPLYRATEAQIRRAVETVRQIDKSSLSPIDRDMAELLFTVADEMESFLPAGAEGASRAKSSETHYIPVSNILTSTKNVISSAIDTHSIAGAVKKSLETVNSHEGSEKEITAVEQLTNSFSDDYEKIAGLSLAEIIAMADSSDDTTEPEIGNNYDFSVEDDSLEAATDEDEDNDGEGLSEEELEAYNDAVWERIQKKREDQRKAAEKKARTAKWYKRLRARQAAEWAEKLRRERELEELAKQLHENKDKKSSISEKYEEVRKQHGEPLNESIDAAIAHSATELISGSVEKQSSKIETASRVLGETKKDTEEADVLSNKALQRNYQSRQAVLRKMQEQKRGKTGKKAKEAADNEHKSEVTSVKSNPDTAGQEILSMEDEYFSVSTEVRQEIHGDKALSTGGTLHKSASETMREEDHASEYSLDTEKESLIMDVERKAASDAARKQEQVSQYQDKGLGKETVRRETSSQDNEPAGRPVSSHSSYAHAQVKEERATEDLSIKDTRTTTVSAEEEKYPYVDAFTKQEAERQGKVEQLASDYRSLSIDDASVQGTSNHSEEKEGIQPDTFADQQYDSQELVFQDVRGFDEEHQTDESEEIPIELSEREVPPKDDLQEKHQIDEQDRVVHEPSALSEKSQAESRDHTASAHPEEETNSQVNDQKEAQKEEYDARLQDEAERNSASVRQMRQDAQIRYESSEEFRRNYYGIGQEEEKKPECGFTGEMPYFAVLYKDGRMEFKRSDHTTLGADNSVIAFWTDFEQTSYTSDLGEHPVPWAEYKPQVQSIVICDEVSPMSIDNWFSGMENLQYFDGNAMDIGNLISLDGVFEGDKSLSSFEAAAWERANPISAEGIFRGCDRLREAVIQHWALMDRKSLTVESPDSSHAAEEYVSFYEQDKYEAMEADIQAGKTLAEEQNQDRVVKMAANAQERVRQAEEFSANRHQVRTAPEPEIESAQPQIHRSTDHRNGDVARASYRDDTFIEENKEPLSHEATINKKNHSTVSETNEGFNGEAGSHDGQVPDKAEQDQQSWPHPEIPSDDPDPTAAGRKYSDSVKESYSGNLSTFEKKGSGSPGHGMAFRVIDQAPTIIGENHRENNPVQDTSAGKRDRNASENVIETETIDRKSIYAILHGDGTLVFRYTTAEEIALDSTVCEHWRDVDLSAASVPWESRKTEVKAVAFESEMAPDSITGWFSGMENLERFDGEKLDISKITNLDGAFEGDRQLTLFEAKSWNVANVQSADCLFRGCESLSEQTLPQWISLLLPEGKEEPQRAFSYGEDSQDNGQYLDNELTESPVISMGSQYGESAQKSYKGKASLHEKQHSESHIDLKKNTAIQQTEPSISDPLPLQGRTEGITANSEDKSVHHGIGQYKGTDSRTIKDTALYAILYGNGRLIFRYSTEEEIASDSTISAYWPGFGISDSSVPWEARKPEVKEVTFEAELAPDSITGWFSGMENLERFDGEKLEISKIDSLDGAFEGDRSLVLFEGKSWNAANIQSAENAFRGCDTLKAEDIPPWASVHQHGKRCEQQEGRQSAETSGFHDQHRPDIPSYPENQDSGKKDRKSEHNAAEDKSGYRSAGQRYSESIKGSYRNRITQSQKGDIPPPTRSQGNTGVQKNKDPTSKRNLPGETKETEQPVLANPVKSMTGNLPKSEAERVSENVTCSNKGLSSAVGKAGTPGPPESFTKSSDGFPDQKTGENPVESKSCENDRGSDIQKEKETKASSKGSRRLRKNLAATAYRAGRGVVRNAAAAELAAKKAAVISVDQAIKQGENGPQGSDCLAKGIILREGAFTGSLRTKKTPKIQEKVNLSVKDKIQAVGGRLLAVGQDLGVANSRMAANRPVVLKKTRFGIRYMMTPQNGIQFLKDRGLGTKIAFYGDAPLLTHTQAKEHVVSPLISPSIATIPYGEGKKKPVELVNTYVRTATFNKESGEYEKTNGDGRIDVLRSTKDNLPSASKEVGEAAIFKGTKAERSSASAAEKVKKAAAWAADDLKREIFGSDFDTILSDELKDAVTGETYPSTSSAFGKSRNQYSPTVTASIRKSKESLAAAEKGQKPQVQGESKTVGSRIPKESCSFPKDGSHSSGGSGGDGSPVGKGIGRKKDPGGESRENQQTAFSRYVGRMFSAYTKTDFVESTSRTMFGAQKRLVLSALDQTIMKTEAGQGYRQVKRQAKDAKAYIGSAMAMASLAGAAFSLGGAAGTNILELSRLGMNTSARYIRGEGKPRPASIHDAVRGEMHLRKGGNFIPFSNQKRIRQEIEELRARFTIDGKDILVGRFMRQQKIGGRIMMSADRGRLKAAIRLTKDKIQAGKGEAFDHHFLSGAEELISKDKAMRLGAKIGLAKASTRRLIRYSSRLISIMDSNENAAAQGVQYIARTYSILEMTTRVGVVSGRLVLASGKLLLNTRPGRLLAKHSKRRAKILATGAAWVGKTAVKGVSTAAVTVGRAAGKRTGNVVKTAERVVTSAAAGTEKAIVTKALKKDYNTYRQAKKQYIEKAKTRIHGMMDNSAAMLHNLSKGTKKITGAVGRELNGGIYNRVMDASIGKSAKEIGTAAGKALGYAAKPFRAVRNIATNIRLKTSRTAEIAKKPFKAIGNLWTAIGNMKRTVIFVLAIVLLLYFILFAVGMLVISISMVFNTDKDNLQQYIDYAYEISESWYKGTLADSKQKIDGRWENLNSLYDKGGNAKGRYRIITTNYVDKYGRKVDSSDNIKDILAMVSEKTQNSWPDSWDLIDLPWGDDKWTVGEVKGIIKHLYAASHSWTASEKGPYPYYKEVNEQEVNLLNSYASGGYRENYLASDFEYVQLMGDAEGEACEGPRSFFCTEDYTPDISSEYRKRMVESYRARGGCEVDYQGGAWYNAATDTLELLGGTLHDGRSIITDAHAQLWATQDMKERYAKAQENAMDPTIDGAGDELKKRHGNFYHSLDPPAGCFDYDKIETGYYAHTPVTYGDPPAGCSNFDSEFVYYKHGESNYNPPLGCENYVFETEYSLPLYNADSPWGGSIYFFWNTSTLRYEAKVLDIIYYVEAYTYHYYTDRSYLHYCLDTRYNLYYPKGACSIKCKDEVYKHTCRDELCNYECRERTAYCDGRHYEYVKVYHCPGHEEYWCSQDHYDLEVQIHIGHFPELFRTDVENSYHYKRKAVAVAEYPEGFDKTEENGDSPFYWDKENRDEAKFLANSKWTDLYGDVEGVDDVDVELDEDTVELYRKYFIPPTIKEWRVGIPYGLNGSPVEVNYAEEAAEWINGKPYDAHGNLIPHVREKWFYDAQANDYVKLRLSGSTYIVKERSGTSPLGISTARQEIMSRALDAVGKIPYEEDGAPGDGADISDFGWNEDEETGELSVVRGLNSGGFVNWVFQTAGWPISSTDSIVKIWEATEEIGNRKTVKDEDLKPGDLGFINTYDDRINPEVPQTEEDIIPYNTVGIYLGTSSVGQRIWIQCSRTNETVSITTTNAFNYFRRHPGID
ncbi:MAG: BspA family leucine-rich repeat surface protein [Blautia sp.]|nr:BspA family leucine-rich repeat surface protein [Blautia sp.]